MPGSPAASTTPPPARPGCSRWPPCRLLAGLSGEAYRVPAAVDSAFRTAMLICAGLLVTGAVTAFTTVRGNVLAPEDHPVAEPDCTYACGTAPPLDPGHAAAGHGEGPATGSAAGPTKT